MSKRTVPDLKELFKQASEIAQQVPESMQEAEFNRAIDILTGSTTTQSAGEQTTPKNKRRRDSSKRTKPESGDSPASDLLAAIDSTQHPGVISASKVLDRSLMVLQIAITDHEVDGLTPRDIAKILTDKFRVSTTQAAVSMALGKATNLINRVSCGSGFSYRIMGPGEEYLAHLSNPDTTPPSPKKKKSKKKAASQNTVSKVKPTRKKSKPVKSGGKDKPSKVGTGPKAAVFSLIDSGFFTQGRTGPEVKTYLKDKRGFNFGTSQLRLAMLRLVREDKLNRGSNSEGQYEYKQPKP